MEDISIPASPKEFLEMFIHAKYIITDTFHGTVFSLICHKNFVSIIRKNGFKVKYLLDSAHLSHRIAENNIESIIEETLDFKYFDEWVEKERAKSKDYVAKNIEAAR